MWPPSHVEVEKASGFIPGIPCQIPDLKHDQKRFIHIPSLNVSEMGRLIPS